MDIKELLTSISKVRRAKARNSSNGPAGLVRWKFRTPGFARQPHERRHHVLSAKWIAFSIALTLLALLLRVTIGAGGDEGGATSHAVSGDVSGDNTASIPDFDGDGTVGFSDFLAFAGAFGSSRGDDKYKATYDLNGDGEVGFGDFLIFAQHFGKEAPSGETGGSGNVDAVFDSLMLAFTRERDIGAAALGVMRNGKIVYDRAFG